MRALHILDRYGDGVRRQRATHEEIRDIVSGRNSDRLARVELGDDGDLVTHELTAEELSALAADLDAMATRALRSMLDAAATLAQQVAGIGFDGVSLGSFGVLSIWVERANGLEKAALAWAEERGLEVVRSSPPKTEKRWYPDATVTASGRDIVRIIWPAVEVNTESAVKEEIAKVTEERDVAARELEAF